MRSPQDEEKTIVWKITGGGGEGFDLRERIRGGRRRSRSRSRSYSPPPPPSHPSRMKYQSKRRTEEVMEKHRRTSESSRRHRSRSRTRRKSGTKSRRDSSSSSNDSRETFELLAKEERIRKELRDLDNNENKRKKHKSGSGDSKKSKKTKRRKSKYEDSSDSDDTSSIENFVRQVGKKSKSRKRHKSDKSDKSRKSDKSPMYEPGSPDSSDSPPVMTPKTYFKPKPEQEEMLQGYKRCPVCTSYHEDTEEGRRNHLSQHPDRVFQVSLPSDSYYFTIEDAIVHLVKLGIPRLELEQKTRTNKLIQNPSNLRGFSCANCQTLDCNTDEIFLRHMKDECGVKDKAERWSHLLCFCRGCQGHFPDKESLDDHISSGRSCWPSSMTINRLYDMVRDNQSLYPQQQPVVNVKQELADNSQDMVRNIKRERLECMMKGPQAVLNNVRVKQERLELQQQGSLSRLATALPTPPYSNTSLQTPSPSTYSRLQFSTPEVEEPFNAYSQDQREGSPHSSSTSPSTNDLQSIVNAVNRSNGGHPSLVAPQFSHPPPDFSRPPPNIIPSADTVARLRQTLREFTPQPGACREFTPDGRDFSPQPRQDGNPRFSSPSLGRMVNDPRAKKHHYEEPSPLFSPIRPLAHSSSSSATIPTPATPLPKANDLFQHQDDVVGLDIIPKVASQAACARVTCLWPDEHVATCRRKQILDTCAAKKCNWSALHSPQCPNLNFNCNGQKIGDTQYKWYTPEDIKDIKIIRENVPHGQDAQRANENKSIALRLLYRRISKTMKDPRLQQEQYPYKEDIPPKSIRGKGKGWKGSIFTWSYLPRLRVLDGDNPYAESDHESDIELCDD